MFEGRANASGLSIVLVALVALVAFTGLLYVRGASGPPLPIAGAIGGPTPRPTLPPTPSPSASPSALASGASAAPGTSAASTAGTSAKPTATESAEPIASASETPSPTPRPTATPRPSPSPTPKPTPRPRPTRTPRPSPSSSGAGFQLPVNPQPASANLDNGQGGCNGFPSGGVVITTTFRIPGPGLLTAASPLGQVLSGRVSADGTFSLAGQSPVESWSGRLTASGGTGTYSVVSNGCTESYVTTITFT